VGDRVAFGIMPIDDPAVSAAEPGQTHAKSQTLTRSELYELVWSKPVCDVAEEIGVSGMVLAKRCRRLRIPVPPKGYWSHVAVGQKPFRPKLPDHHPQYGDRQALTFRGKLQATSAADWRGNSRIPGSVVRRALV
jgi:hypothetical protein